MTMLETPRYLGVQSRGIVAIPVDIRRRHHLDQPGAQVRIVERNDGVIELHPSLPIPADQHWFWTKRWQQRELEVDEYIARGQTSKFDSTNAFLDHLLALESNDK